MQNNNSLFFNKNVVKEFYYKNSAKLFIRLSAWKKFGVNRHSLNDWLWSLLKLRQILKKPKISILDIGCGTGEMLALFKKKQSNLNIYGIDVSPRMIKKAAYKNKKSKQNFILSDAAKLPYENDFFDITTAIFVLHHVPKLPETIKELLRVTKKSGLIMIADGDYEVREGLNAVYYSAIKKADLPVFMKNTSAYLRTSKKRIEQILSKLNVKKRLQIYKNKMVFRDVKEVLRYFQSGMMYRNTCGPTDKRVTARQWRQLYQEVRYRVSDEIEEKGKFIVPGNVYCYLISKK